MDLKTLFLLANEKGLPYFEGNFTRNKKLIIWFSQHALTKGDGVEIFLSDNNVNNITGWRNDVRSNKDAISDEEIFQFIRDF